MINLPDGNEKINRREFVNRAGSMMALGTVGFSSAKSFASDMKASPAIRIKNVDSNFEREPLFPYHFKGSFITEAWHTAAWLESESGIHKTGLGCQSPLWSDSKVFAAHSTNGGNALMYAMSERALQIMKGNSFTSPL